MTLSTQFITMLSMIGMGAFFGAALDTYNRFLQRRKRKSWLVFINDILFWLFQGLFIFFILFHVNQGELRFYIFLALLCGFAAYQSILKQLYLKCLEKLISIVIAVFRLFGKTYPFTCIQAYSDPYLGSCYHHYHDREGSVCPIKRMYPMHLIDCKSIMDADYVDFVTFLETLTERS